MKLAAPFILFSTALFIEVHQRHGANAAKCSKNCMPLEMIHCDDNTGECSEGCNMGYYGLTCDKICQCSGGACHVNDGKCMDVSTVKSVSTVKPVLASLGNISENKDCSTVAVPLVACCLVLLVVVFIMLFIPGKEKIWQICKGKVQTSSQTGEGQEMLPKQDNSNKYDNNGTWSLIVSAILLASAIYSSLRFTSDQLTDSQKDMLESTLGVHFLYRTARQPVMLFCPGMIYDYRRVNRTRSHLNRNNVLLNEPDGTTEEHFPEEFKTFRGTTSLSPVFHVDTPTYWEVHTSFHLNKELEETDLLLIIGLCRERHRDQSHQIKVDDHCYSLTVGLCSDHNKRICTKVYRETQIFGNTHEKANIRNNKGEQGKLDYGVLVYKERKAILFFDLSEMKCIAHIKNVNFEAIDYKEPLWPMFGVNSMSSSKISMKLVTGRTVQMKKNKKKMILNAL